MTPPFERGYQAFHAGEAISVCPSDLTLPEYEEYRKGWAYADKERWSTCIGNDPYCPCQDGDACHYRDLPGSPAMRPKATQRPKGSNADEWRLFLCQHLDGRVTSEFSDPLSFIAVQIADAIDEQTEQLRIHVPESGMMDIHYAICVLTSEAKRPWHEHPTHSEAIQRVADWLALKYQETPHGR